MAQHYSNPKREKDAHALPDLETFGARIMRCSVCGAEYPETDRGGTQYRNTDDETTCCHGEPLVKGDWAVWYWYCFPGCLPDSDAIGPFESEDAALADARAYCDEGPDDEDDPDGDDYETEEEF